MSDQKPIGQKYSEATTPAEKAQILQQIVMKPDGVPFVEVSKADRAAKPYEKTTLILDASGKEVVTCTTTVEPSTVGQRASGGLKALMGYGNKNPFDNIERSASVECHDASNPEIATQRTPAVMKPTGRIVPTK